MYVYEKIEYKFIFCLRLVALMMKVMNPVVLDQSVHEEHQHLTARTSLLEMRELCWNNFRNNDGVRESRIILEF